MMGWAGYRLYVLYEYADFAMVLMKYAVPY